MPKSETVVFITELHGVEGVDASLVHGDGEVLRGPRAAELVEDLLDVEPLLEGERARRAIMRDLDAEQDRGLTKDLDVVARTVRLDKLLVSEITAAARVADDDIVDVDGELDDVVSGDLAPDVGLGGALLEAEALDGLVVADHPQATSCPPAWSPRAGVGLGKPCSRG